MISERENKVENRSPLTRRAGYRKRKNSSQRFSNHPKYSAAKTNQTKHSLSSSNSNVSNRKRPSNEPYDPEKDKVYKPPYSFSSLIFMAIEESPNKALPVKEVYSWVVKHFPFYRDAPEGWKNSVRHNLSLSKCFKKVEKAPVIVHFTKSNSIIQHCFEMSSNL